MSTCELARQRLFAPGVDDPEALAHLASCEACRAVHQALPAVDALLGTLRQSDVPPPSFDRLAAEASAIGRTQRRGRRVRRVAPVASAGLVAAGLLVVFGWMTAASWREPPLLSAPGGSIGANQSARVPSGAVVSVESGSVELAAAEPAREQLRLQRGSVTVQVPVLSQGSVLEVETPDAAVRVHGTRFRVLRDQQGTSVWVSEGLVEVAPLGKGRPPVFLSPGDTLVTEPLDVYRDGLRTAARRALERGELDAADRELEQLLATEPEALVAAEAEALLAWALAARGQRRDAIAAYETALARLPDEATPLWADNAQAELALLVEADDPPRAARLWQTYLDRFPSGVHAGAARARLERHERP